MSRCYIGTSGYIQQHHFYPDDVKGKKKFPFYTSVFNSVEINSSFYRTPNMKTIEEWKKSAQEDFIFTFKVLRYTLQYNPFNLQSFNTWFERFKPFETGQHILLFQYPSSRKYDLDYLSGVLEALPDTFKYAFEFRDQSWFREGVYSLLRKHNAALVLNDSPRKLTGGRTWPLVDVDTADFTFIRFHGSLAMYASGYLPGELLEYARLIKKKMKEGKDIFCYFNNDMLGYAVTNAKELMALI